MADTTLDVFIDEEPISCARFQADIFGCCEHFRNGRCRILLMGCAHEEEFK